MASIAFDSGYEEEAARPPLSLHPAFPAIVALWFAALLGIGSLVLPAVLLERLVTTTGIASLVPAAAPPLGLTARSLIAVAGALAGAGLGVAIARRVARAHRPQPLSRVAKLANGSRRPISVHEELGGEGVVNGEAPPLNRRRALAISEDDRPSDFLYQVPVPGVDPDAPAPFAAAPIVSAVADDEEPLELDQLAEDGAASAEQAAPAEADPEEFAEDFEMTESRESVSAWPSHQHIPAEELAPVDELDSRKNLAGPRGLEPLPFAAPSLARKAPRVEFELVPQPAPEPEPAPEQAVQLEAVAPAADEPEYRADWQTAPLDGLGLVQLVQRLGSTIERRREWAAQHAAPAEAPVAAPLAAAPADFDPAPAEEAAQAMAAFFAPDPEPVEDEPVAAGPVPVEPEPEPAADESEPEPAAMPRPGFLSALAPADEDDDEDAVPDFSLPLRRPAAAAPADNDAANEAEEEAGGGYSSLLGLSNPFAAPKSEFVRIEEPEEEAGPAAPEPAVVFPGQEEPAPAAGSGGRLFDPPARAAGPASAPQAPADADAALRAALATLQRMSGAA